MVFAIGGLAIAALLAIAHFRLAHGQGEEGAYCLFAQVFDCDRVNTSEFAEIRGIPVALLGEAAYVAFFGLAFLALLSEPSPARRLGSYLLALGVAATAFCGYLVYVSAFELEAFCSLCLALDAITVAILIASLFVRPGGARAIARETAGAVATFFLRGEAWCGVLIFAGTATVLAQQQAAARDRVLEATLGSFEAYYSKLPVEKVSTDGDRPSLGPPGARVAIVVFSDFQCPHCRRLAGALGEVRAKFPSRVRVIFRHFPISTDCNPCVAANLHKGACRAALAAEAAREQGRFWEFHDRLFAGPGPLNEQRLLAVAAEAGLDMDRFRARWTAQDLKARIAEDAALGRALGITGTPLVFVNGRRLRSISAEVLAKAVTYELYRVGGP